MWSRILSSRNSCKYYVDQTSMVGVHMPFGFTSERTIEFGRHGRRHRYPMFELSWKRHESQIKRLVDNLPPGLFQNSHAYLDTIQGIGSSDLENFLLFLQNEPLRPVSSVKSRKPTPPLIDVGHHRLPKKAGTSRLGLHFNAKIWGIDASHHDRILREKLGRFSVVFDIVETRDLRSIPEFTVHLENLSAIYYSKYALHPYDGPNLNWKVYCEQLELDPSLSKFLTCEHRPRCLSQSYYWRSFNIPKNAPPTLGVPNSEHDTSDVTGIRFVGYITEIVRNRLAKWTATADLEHLSESTWTTEIPEEWSMEFQPGCDFLRLFEVFGGMYKDSMELNVPYISLGNEYHDEDPFQWTGFERILFECQKYLLDLLDGDERVFGPGDLELVLLFLLGFPVLEVRVFMDNVLTLKPAVPAPSLAVVLFLKRNNADDASIVIQIHSRTDRLLSPIPEGIYDPSSSERPVQFCWEEWIHMFDGCMKVLSMEFDDGDVCIESSNKDVILDFDTAVVGYTGRQEDAKKVAEGISVNTSENIADQENSSNGNHDGGCSDFEVSDALGDEIRDDSVGNANTIPLSKEDIDRDCQGGVENADENEIGGNDGPSKDGDRESEIEIGTSNGDINVVERKAIEQSETSECDRVGDHNNDEEVCQVKDRKRTTSKSTMMSSSTDWSDISIHRCSCQYALNKRAEKRGDGWTDKYFWHWEGWKPQPAFERYPLTYKREGDNDENATSVERNETGVESVCSVFDLVLAADRRLYRVEETEERQQPASDGRGGAEETIVELGDGRGPLPCGW
ncbi:hypothetical protein FGB62_70g19 [Gracilaria domingensis]|nr:hypothetical protein FGB62_70g19 [Gracilaria domingensis]